MAGRERRFLSLAALGVGIAALVPCLWPLQIGGVILGTIAIIRSRKNGDRRGLAFAMAGVALSLLGGLGSVLLLALGAFP
jgi:hypothetical protein